MMAVPASAEVTSALWQTEKSQHFVIYYQESPAGFVDEVITKAEDYYNSIVDELGFRRFDFWNWDNRAKIYLYKDSLDYHNDTQRVGWSGAIVSVKERTIKTYIGQENFFDSILPHEMTHIIFREFIGDKKDLPLWVDEGIASSQEKSSLALRLQIAKKLIQRNLYLKFDKLSEIKDSTLVSPNVFYAESASIIVFLMEQFGKDRFLDLSRKVRDGTEWQKALLSTYGFASLDEMEQAWKNFMLKQH